MRLEAVRIPSGGVELAALRYVPDRPLRPTALIYAHGFTSGKYSLDNLANYLAGRGYPGLTFDFVGHKLGCTGGEMRHISQAAENLQDALRWLRAHSEAEQVVLIGHSMGWAAVLEVAAQERRHPSNDGARLAGIVCMSIGLEPTRGFDNAVGRTMLAQRSDYVVGAPALELLSGLDTLILATREIGNLPALFIAARQDVLVSVARVEQLAALAGPAASVTTLDTSHLDAPDRSRSTIAQWLDQQNL